MRVSSRSISELLWQKASDQQADVSTFLCVLKACSSLTDLEAGRRVHYDAVQAGLDTNIYIGNTLINMYGKCGSMEEAGKVFQDMSFRNAVSWNTLLLGYVENGDEATVLSLFDRMQQESKAVPDARTYAAVAKSCAALAGKEPSRKVDGKSVKLLALERGRQVHSQALKLGGGFDMFLASAFIDMFSKCGSMKESREVFEKMVRRDRVSWNALILGYTENGEEDHALELLSCMKREEGCSPNARSFVAGLKACSSLALREPGRRVDGKVVKVEALRRGMSLHSQVVESGCELELYVAGALVDMYSKCGSLERARVIFDKTQSYGSVSWNSLMLGYVESQEEEEALKLFACMKARGCLPDARSYVAALKACSGLSARQNGKPVKVALEKGKAIHKMAVEDGFDKDIFVASTLVDMYSRCRSMRDAKEVFEGMKTRNAVSWTALILGFVENQDETTALELFARMQTEQGCEPNALTFIAAIKACSGIGVKETAQEVGGRLVKVEALKAGVELHQQARNRLLDSDVFLSSALVEMYSKCGSLSDCKAVFDGMPHRDVVSWNAMLSAYVENGEEEQALELLRCMDCEPDARTYVASLKACTGLAVKEHGRLLTGEPESLVKGLAIHAEAAKAGFELDSYVSTSLVDMYAKCGRMEEARDVYDRASARTPALWTALVLGYLENSEEDSVPELLETLPPGADAQTFVAALKSCATLAASEASTKIDGKLVKARWLEKGKALHTRAAGCGLDSDPFVANTLVDMYTKCGSLVDARRVFERTRTVVSCNALMLGYIKAGEADLALELFQSMQRDGFSPDLRSYTAAVKACSALAAREQGETVDGQVFKLKSLEKAMELESRTVSNGARLDAYSAGSLAELYAKCGSVRDCYRVLERTPSCNVFTWNSLLRGYVESGEEELGLELFRWMQEGNHVDAQTVVCALKACIGLAAKDNGASKVKSLKRGKEIHELAVEAGLDSSLFVAATLVSMYCKCGSLQEAFQLFSSYKLLQHDVVLWNVLILGFAEGGEEQQAFEAFNAMREAQVCQPDDGTYIAVLKACGNAASLELTREVSAEIARNLGGAEDQLANAMLDAFGKCGSMSVAQHAFDSLATADLVSWNSLVSGYSHRGDAKLVLSLFHDMQARGLKANGISLVCVLAACSHAGLVEKAQEYFEAMVSKFGISPGLEHYHCMIDALGRSNQLKAAVGLVRNMVVEPNAVTWLTVLAACHKWKNVEVGQVAFQSLLKMEDGDTAAAYTLMSNIWS